MPAHRLRNLVENLKFENYVFLCGWTFQASHEKNIKKIPPTPTPQLNFVARCQNAAQLFFSLRIIAPGAGGFFTIFLCEAGRFQRQFYDFAKLIFHEKTCYLTNIYNFFSKFSSQYVYLDL